MTTPPTEWTCRDCPNKIHTDRADYGYGLVLLDPVWFNDGPGRYIGLDLWAPGSMERLPTNGSPLCLTCATLKCANMNTGLMEGRQ